MTAMILLALVALQAKHLVFDFLLQVPYMYANKGRYGHPGGLAHAGLHGLGTLLVLMPFSVSFSCILAIAAVEAVFHYHVDWAKEQVTSRHKLTTADTGFWAILGVDQAIHHLTYVAIVAVIWV